MAWWRPKPHKNKEKRLCRKISGTAFLCVEEIIFQQH